MFVRKEPQDFYPIEQLSNVYMSNRVTGTGTTNGSAPKTQDVLGGAVLYINSVGSNPHGNMAILVKNGRKTVEDPLCLYGYQSENSEIRHFPAYTMSAVCVRDGGRHGSKIR
jgi:hypothetical protein